MYLRAFNSIRVHRPLTSQQLSFSNKTAQPNPSKTSTKLLQTIRSKTLTFQNPLILRAIQSQVSIGEMSLDLASIVVVTTKGCPYCKKAKALLKEEGYDYSELELTTDKELLQKVKDFTGQRTVPQIFIGNDFMGGASELLKIKDDGLLKEKIEAAKQKQLDSKTKELFTAMQQAKESSESKTYPGCFSKEEYLELQQISESLGDEPLTSKQIEEQTKKCDIQPLIRKLQEANLIVSINPEAKTPEWAQYQTTVSVTGPKSLNQPLNTHFKFYGEARSANVVAGELREMILGLYDKYLSADGKAVDYSGIASDEQCV
eukprot:TRINITY_DN16945_c0_g1_i8.p2 TRINITY_DN16945_c0_g1~~TRINITY_DN16945_c0_g1_i8.p2  ORF type:complete len:317 (-),score=50.50 TRINITY_DN16945_c0_g1_i8:57-1007(-)